MKNLFGIIPPATTLLIVTEDWMKIQWSSNYNGSRRKVLMELRRRQHSVKGIREQR